MRIDLVTWNVRGARILETPDVGDFGSRRISRQDHIDALNAAVRDLVRRYRPDIVAMQEIVEYTSPHGLAHTPVIKVPEGYKYISTLLVDDIRHPGADKWRNVRKKGRWPQGTHFYQGNAFCLSRSLHVVPCASEPFAAIPLESHENPSQDSHVDKNITEQGMVTVVQLESGFYFGDRETEPRCGVVLHLVFNVLLPEVHVVDPMPIDVFVVNVHLTRMFSDDGDGVESSPTASEVRQRQLQTLLDEVVRRYDAWRERGYPIRGEKRESKSLEGKPRLPPVWIIAGDFNFVLGTPEHHFLESAGFVELLPEPVSRPENAVIGVVDGVAVDHVFLRQSGPPSPCSTPCLSIKGYLLPCEGAQAVSDHAPVRCRIVVNAPSPGFPGGPTG